MLFFGQHPRLRNEVKPLGKGRGQSERAQVKKFVGFSNLLVIVFPEEVLLGDLIHSDELVDLLKGFQSGEKLRPNDRVDPNQIAR